MSPGMPLGDIDTLEELGDSSCLLQGITTIYLELQAVYYKNHHKKCSLQELFKWPGPMCIDQVLSCLHIHKEWLWLEF